MMDEIVVRMYCMEGRLLPDLVLALYTLANCLVSVNLEELLVYYISLPSLCLQLRRTSFIYFYVYPCLFPCFSPLIALVLERAMERAPNMIIIVLIPCQRPF
jgi:hypothetical protein